MKRQFCPIFGDTIMAHYVFVLEIETGLYALEFSGNESDCYQWIELNYFGEYNSNEKTPQIKLVRDL